MLIVTIKELRKQILLEFGPNQTQDREKLVLGLDGRASLFGGEGKIRAAFIIFWPKPLNGVLLKLLLVGSRESEKMFYFDPSKLVDIPFSSIRASFNLITF